MKPILCLLAALIATFPPSPVRAANSVLPGTMLRLHVERPGGQIERLEGRLVATGDTLVLRIPRGEGVAYDTVRVAVDEVTRAQVSDGKKISKTGPIVAGVWGAGIGFLLGGYYVLANADSDAMTTGEMYGVVIGATVAGGALFGFFTHWTSSQSAPPAWREVPTSWLRGS